MITDDFLRYTSAPKVLNLLIGNSKLQHFADKSTNKSCISTEHIFTIMQVSCNTFICYIDKAEKCWSTALQLNVKLILIPKIITFFTLWDLFKIQFLFKGETKIYFHPTVLCGFTEIITQTISCKQNKCNEFIQNTRSSDVL